MKPGERVDELKQQIHDLEGFPLETFRLVRCIAAPLDESAPPPPPSMELLDDGDCVLANSTLRVVIGSPGYNCDTPPQTAAEWLELAKSPLPNWSEPKPRLD